VYQLTCHKKYIGQTDRPFHVRFREHYIDYKYPNNKSKFAQHVLEEGRSFGPVNEIMDVLHIAKKGGMLDTLERFYIFRET
jgi:transposase